MSAIAFAYDGQALEVIADKFTWRCGVIRARQANYTPTEVERLAISYLCNEWDYVYEAPGDTQ